MKLRLTWKLLPCGLAFRAGVGEVTQAAGRELTPTLLLNQGPHVLRHHMPMYNSDLAVVVDTNNLQNRLKRCSTEQIYI